MKKEEMIQRLDVVDRFVSSAIVKLVDFIRDSNDINVKDAYSIYKDLVSAKRELVRQATKFEEVGQPQVDETANEVKDTRSPHSDSYKDIVDSYKDIVIVRSPFYGYEYEFKNDYVFSLRCVDLIKSGRKIDAIKELRSTSGLNLNLKDVKDAVFMLCEYFNLKGIVC